MHSSILLLLAACADPPPSIRLDPGRGLPSSSRSVVSDLAPGDLVITEILQNPSVVSDSAGEWFEVYNAIGADVDLAGVKVSDSTGSNFTVSRSLIVAAGDYVVFGKSTSTSSNGGAPVDYAFGSSMSLGNVSDDLEISYGGVTLARVAWDGGASFPDPEGASMTLDPTAFGASASGANWCEASSTFGRGDRGTPGAANDSCGLAPDADGDGSPTGTDCDDTNPSVHPGAAEICDGLDDDCDGAMELSVPTAYRTIGAAITAASDGDLVCVAAGTYTETLDFAGKDITIEGAGASSSYVGGTGGGPIVRFDSAETSAAVLRGVTVLGGDAQAGGGLYIDGASPRIEDVVIDGATCTAYDTCTGGAIYLKDSSAAFDGVEVTNTLVERNNRAALTFSGGAVYIDGGAPTFVSVDFRDNEADVSGGSTSSYSRVYGGVLYVTGSNPVFDDVGFASNRALGLVNDTDHQIFGGVMYLDGADPTFTNVTFVDQTSKASYIGGGVARVRGDSDPQFTNVIFAGNDAGDPTSTRYSKVSGGLFEVDSGLNVPVFVNVDIVGNTATAYDVYGGMFHVDCGGSTAVASGIRMVNVNIVSDLASGSHYSYGTFFYAANRSRCSTYMSTTYSNQYNDGNWYGWTFSSGTGNVAYDPRYTDTTATLAEDWNLRLASGSPVANLGDPSRTDADGTRSAMGAFGGAGGDDW